jgi:hypothetical protein
MKLGEALVHRSQLQKRFQQLRERLKAAAVVQEGEKPPEDPRELLQELSRVLTELEHLVRRINHTNIATTLPDGTRVTDALARRDVITYKQVALRELADFVSEQRRRYGKAELRLEPTVDAGVLRREHDELARERRELDVALQEVNWQTELLD